MSTAPSAAGGRRWSATDIAAALGSPAPTPQQVAVIEAPLAPTLVVAGAGSGKTETMAARVVWLVTNGLVRPEEVLGLTFTRKAAIELSERLSRRLRAVREAGLWSAGPERDLLALPTVSTYHAYAARLVAEHGLRIGVEPDARLLTEAAAWQVASEIVAAADAADVEGVDAAASTLTRAVLAVSGELAEHLVDDADAEALLTDLAARVEALPGRDDRPPLKVGRDLAADLRAMARIYPLVRRYRDALAGQGAADFASQMAGAARLARDLPVVGRVERQRFGAVLLDEFQDTSEAQLVLLTSLFGRPDLAVTAVGDPHQSIYGWRGASATTLVRFRESFGAAGRSTPVLPLTTSWRNARDILTVANLVAAPLRAHSRVEVRELGPRPGVAAGRIEVARLTTHEEEAEHLARWVKERWEAGTAESAGVPGAGAEAGLVAEAGPAAEAAPVRPTAAVLCRNRAQFPTVVAALRRAGLPVEVVGLGGLLSAPEVADLVALLTVVQDPTRGDQLMRLLTGPVCRLGAADLDGLWAWARHLDRDQPLLSEAVRAVPPPGWADSAGRGIGEVARSRVGWLGRVIDRVRGLVGLPLPDLVVAAERALGLDLEVAADPDQPAAWARAQLDALVDVAHGFAGSAHRPTLGGFVDWLEAARTHERGLEPAEVAVSPEAVQVLTIHAAKGLEWDVVAVPGLAEGIFPAYSASSSWTAGQWEVPQHKHKGWLTGVDSLPYPLRGDADGLPTLPWDSLADTHELAAALERHREAGGRHAVAEERRLAYVAFTRARAQLLLTTPVWSTGSTPRVTSRFLQEVMAAPGTPVRFGPWAPMPEPSGDGTAVNPLLEQQTRVPWPVERAQARREAADLVQVVLEAQRDHGATAPSLPPADELGERIGLLLAERAEAAARAGAGPELEVAHLSTSALVALAADPDGFTQRRRRPVPTAPAVRARQGTDFHAWVEQHFAAAALVDLDDLPGQDEAPAASLERLRESFLASSWADRSPVAVELDVETVIAGVAVRGRIDAVFAGADGAHTIVDWKTGAEPSPAVAAQRALQLSAYRIAYCRLTGLAPEQVGAAFFYAATGRTVTPELLSEGQVEQLVAELVPAPGGSAA